VGLADAHRNILHRFANRSPAPDGARQDRNAPQKHVWRANVILLSADDVGTVEIMRQDRQVEDLRVALAGSLYR
jgi:hypothetical protein